MKFFGRRKQDSPIDDDVEPADDTPITRLEKALADTRRNFGAEHPETLRVAEELAEAHEQNDDPGRAIPYLAEVLEVRRDELGALDPKVLAIGARLAYDTGRALTQADNPNRAIRSYELALTLHNQVYGPEHPQTLSVAVDLANSYDAVGDFIQLIPLLAEIHGTLSQLYGDDHKLTQALLTRLDEARSRPR